ncbi:MAG: Gfo/Idh/MocA family oxidoreductase [Bosea sp.]|uniref:Gfo/Idh/MocA family protein n=1 Tax=Bosea sp. (in: a-proteobacteria) TaxID=1871050 RepID=UPI002389891F|nr:Gfo/Idh/MocA family oxidoreductase [Bosea sp. (in: a-proteobacteria)]MCP4737025.1 Gfo/Idh/MocA family oxidoreductase [Bosea sp. (in: a-proteobacteria)]
MPAQSSLRIGVLGAANIARLFVAGVRPSAKLEVAAVASRDSARAAAFAKEVGVARSHGSYEALLADPEIEAIYLPLPNGLHAEWAIRALEAGKHVLSEKPISVTAAEAKAMFAAARAAGRHLVEAYPYMAQPQTLTLRELLAARTIGKIRLIRASFGFKLGDTGNVRFDAALGGGALLDAGSYAVSLVRLVTGACPIRVMATSQFDHGVDVTTAGTLEFADGSLAHVSCSMATAFHRQASIIGDGGAIETSYLNHPPIGGAAMLRVKRTPTSPSAEAPELFETIPVEGGNGFLREAESFADLVAGRPPGWTGASPEESIDVMATLDAMKKRAGSRTWVDVER